MRCLVAALLLSAGLAAGLRASPLAGSPFETAVAAVPDTREETAGNRLAILSGGYDALLLRVHLIRRARQSIDIQTFIWTNDECGRLLICELIEAARRGVRVRIIADHLVSDQDPDTVAFLATAHPNLEVRHYRPAMSRIKPTRWQTILVALRSFHDVNQRMHNKVMIFDGAALITGGRNIENTYYDHSPEMNFRDRDVLAVGPAARAAAEAFEEFWKYRHAVPSRELTDVAAAIERGAFRRYATRADYDFGGYFKELTREADDDTLIGERFVARLRPVERAVFICDVPGKSTGVFSRTARITRELRRTLEGAERDILMQTPYLVLSDPARKLFRELRQANPRLRVRISTNSLASTDNLLAYSGNYRQRTRNIDELHFEVHEFMPQPAALPVLFPRYAVMAGVAERRIAAGQQSRSTFLCLHAKSLVVDDRVAFIGSYNLDPRSENLNTEAGLLVEDATFARELRREIERDLSAANSWVIARRRLPLAIEAVNGLLGGLLSLGPVDLWPVQNTTSFELRSGMSEVPPDDPAFHDRYRDVGAFPGADTALSTKEIFTRLYKAVGTPLTPIL